jgi:predicted cupin superfamily sugar epimerase
MVQVSGVKMNDMTAKEVIERLGLKPLPGEGGYFVETHRAAERLKSETLKGAHNGSRSLSTAIYYLLTAETFSAMHRLPGDEIYHFYLGDPVEMLLLKPDGSGEKIILGQDLNAGMRPQLLVKGGVWQGSHLLPGGKFALMGTTMAPGFEFEDYHGGQRAELMRMYPKFCALVSELTRD